ncbi:hypothetical protein GCK72_017919 [Caenorhabditis remanei]|uniref:URB1 C-terminal domain-containing protein n=1 Tax=Caenorhabditis remanei TaxID=31234 RepID=A0A6A5G9R8_CAERE|nr:hypothetical protein GCK72_017919 [Caenorhabditis remanei]KAF1751365.1 hypothetical protein GCK72_017919 [Caenorhabditis remanei]
MGLKKKITSKLARIAEDNWIPTEEYLSELVALLNDAKDDTEAQEKVRNVDMKVLTSLLTAYRATCCDLDVGIFQVLQTLEKFGTDLSDFQPLVFGTEATKNYENLRKMGLDLHVRISPDDAIKTYFDAATLWNTTKYHVRPLTEENAEKIYDVRFVLSFFNSILHPASSLTSKLFVEHNCLALLFSCTSSTDSSVRTLAFACLQKFVNHLQELNTEIFTEKALILYLIRIFKHSFDAAVPRISSIITHFFARVSKLMLNPSSDVYPQIMAFLCMKPIFDIQNVPEFYKLLFSSSPEHHTEEREWVLTLISEAMLEPIDYQVLQNRAGIKLLLSSFASVWLDRKSRALILRTLQNAVQMPSVAHDLFTREGLHIWITSIIQSARFNRWEKNFLAQVFCSLLENERKYQRGEKGKEQACKAATAAARICSKKIMTVLDTISKDPQFTGEQKKALASIERIEKSIGKKWKKKKKFNTPE